MNPSSNARLLPLAHETGTQHGDALWPIVMLVICTAALVAAAAYLIASERRDRVALQSSKGTQQRKAISAGMVTRRMYSGAVALVALAGAIASGIVASQSHTPGSVNVVEPGPADRYPVTISNATPAGEVEGEVRNKTKADVLVQCSIAALDANGESVLTGTWKAYDRLGNEIESPVYTIRFELDPRGSQRFRVDLAPRLNGSVATIDPGCVKRPPPD